MKMRHRRHQTQRKVGYIPMAWKFVFDFLDSIDRRVARVQAVVNRKP